MTKRVIATVFLLVLVFGTVLSRAHDNFRIIGTLVKHQSSTLDVKNAEGKTLSIKMDKQTAVFRDKKKVERSALQVGQSLVVDAYGDSEDDALAVEIQIVPPIRGR